MTAMAMAVTRSLWEIVPLLGVRTAAGAVRWRDWVEGFSTEVAGHRIAIGDVHGGAPGAVFIALLRDGERIDEIEAECDDPRTSALRALLDAARVQCVERERVIDGLIEGLRAMGGR